MIIGCIMETYKNIGLKMNADKSMMMMWEEMKDQCTVTADGD